MLENATETTAMQRLGHVLGWACFGTGGLTVLGALIIIAVQTWVYIYPKSESIGFEATLPDGQKYIAVGTGSSKSDAEKAIQKYLGRQVSMGPYSHWVVFSSIEASGNRADAYALETKKVRALKKATQQKSAIQNITIAAIVGVVPGILILLLGLALRYILVGPMKRPQ